MKEEREGERKRVCASLRAQGFGFIKGYIKRASEGERERTGMMRPISVI
jgi:hypothetical protein